MAKKEKKTKRFEILQQETISLSSQFTVFRDTQTGVQYLFAVQGYGGGLTPLLDKDGKPVIDGVPAEEAPLR